MTKLELMENYTMEQLAEIVTAYEEIKACQEQNKECKTALPAEYLKVLTLNQQLKEKQAEIEKLKSQLNRKQTEINQIDEILNELFGVTHDVAKTTDEFREILSKKSDYNQFEIEKYRCKAEKYQKAFEDAKKERDGKVCEMQNVISRLKNKTISDFIPTEPIKVADMLINASKNRINCMTNKEYDKHIFEKWKLRQIAQHLLVYCNADENEGEECQ